MNMQAKHNKRCPELNVGDTTIYLIKEICPIQPMILIKLHLNQSLVGLFPIILLLRKTGPS